MKASKGHDHELKVKLESLKEEIAERINELNNMVGQNAWDGKGIGMGVMLWFQQGVHTMYIVFNIVFVFKALSSTYVVSLCCNYLFYFKNLCYY